MGKIDQVLSCKRARYSFSIGAFHGRQRQATDGVKLFELTRDSVGEKTVDSST